jgi:hypothetical protein
MRAQLHIIAVEDGVTDAETIERHLANAGLKCVVRQVKTERDITRTESLTEAVAQLQGQTRLGQEAEIELGLAQKLEAVGRLAAEIAHEIDALIQHISGNRARE